MSSIAPGTSAESCPAAATTGLAGTLLWIGPRRHPEMIEAYRDCEANVPQLAYRASIDDACQRPAQCVASVIFARPERSRVEPERLEHLRQSYPDARFACLLSSGCEGEMRTGEPWSRCKRIYWHRWNQEAPDWLFPARTEVVDRSASLFLTIVAASSQQAEPLLELAGQHRWPATWITPGKHSLVRSPTHVLWDDSAAPPADRQAWSQRISPFASQPLLAGDCSAPLHVWLAGFPRLHDWQEARAAGIDWLLSKPVSLSALTRFVSCPLSPKEVVRFSSCCNINT